MVSGHMISLKEILWRVFNNPVAADLNHSDAGEYALEGIKLIGAPLSFIDTVTHPPLVVTSYKAALPSCLLHIRGVKLLGEDGRGDYPLRRATDIYHGSIPCNDSWANSASNADLPTSAYDESNQGVNEDLTSSGNADVDAAYRELTYTAQGGVIQTSFKEGLIEVAYKSIAVDEEGFPMVPDNQKVKLALEYYILFRFLEPIWLAGKITDKAFDYILTKKSFYMASANTDMQLQGGDHLESVMNAVNRLIINDKAFDNAYKGSGQRERIKKYH